MDIITKITEEVKNIFSTETLDALAQNTGFIKRKKKITAKDFLCHHIHLGLDKNSSIEDIAQEFCNSNVEVTKQAVHKKYTENACHFMKRVLEELLNFTTQELFHLKSIPFVKAIKTVDSSYLKLNKGLAEVLPGLRNQGAGVKLQTIMNIATNKLYSLDVRHARENDQSYQHYVDHIEPGELSINDQGYFCVDSFKKLEDKGAFFLSRFLKTTHIYCADKKTKIDFKALLKHTKETTLEFRILLGEARIPCRIVAMHLPPNAYQQRLKNLAEKNRKNGRKKKSKPSIFDEWTIFVTNLPELVVPDTLFTLYSLRWQIELFFKVVKTFLNLRESSHPNPHKALISIYASLIVATILTHCANAIVEKEISLYKAAKVFVRNIKQFIQWVYSGKSSLTWLIQKIRTIAFKEITPNRPSTKQVLGANYA